LVDEAASFELVSGDVVFDWSVASGISGLDMVSTVTKEEDHSQWLEATSKAMVDRKVPNNVS
jgi:hypothetical protein